MAYKDKDRQREAVRQATRRYRAKLQGITEGITGQGITRANSVIPVTPKLVGVCVYCGLTTDQPSPQCARH